MAPTTTDTNVTSKKEKCLENVQKILECPVCYKTPGNPENVHFCSNGHLLCDSCHAQILDKKCPTCRSEDWNNQHALMPLMKQILEALPKKCPYPECEETQFENEERDIHMKKCQYRLVDCFGCSSKLPFNKFLKHLDDDHKTYSKGNINGSFTINIKARNSEIDDPRFILTWDYILAKFDDKSFLVVIYRRQDHFYIQVFFHGSLTEAKNYLCQIKVTNLNDPNYYISFSGEVISVDVPTADQQDHCGTFAFTRNMARKLLCKLDYGQGLGINVTISNKK